MADYVNIYIDREICKLKAGYYDHYLMKMSSAEGGENEVADETGAAIGLSVVEATVLPKVSKTVCVNRAVSGSRFLPRALPCADVRLAETRW